MNRLCNREGYRHVYRSLYGLSSAPTFSAGRPVKGYAVRTSKAGRGVDEAPFEEVSLPSRFLPRSLSRCFSSLLVGFQSKFVRLFHLGSLNNSSIGASR